MWLFIPFIWAFIKKAFPIFIVTLVILIALAYCTVRGADLALGDCIALGTGHALRIPTQAKVSASSCRIADWRHGGSYNHVVISAGINDDGLCVQAVRASVRAKRVIWILPAPINDARSMVLASMRKGDRSVSYVCPGGCSKRSFHPKSYGVLASDIRRIW